MQENGTASGGITASGRKYTYNKASESKIIEITVQEISAGNKEEGAKIAPSSDDSLRTWA